MVLGVGDRKVGSRVRILVDLLVFLALLLVVRLWGGSREGRRVIRIWHCDIAEMMRGHNLSFVPVLIDIAIAVREEKESVSMNWAR